MISGILVKILSVILLIAVAVVLILGIGTLVKGGETAKKHSNKLDAAKSSSSVYCNSFTCKFCLLF